MLRWIRLLLSCLQAVNMHRAVGQLIVAAALGLAAAGCSIQPVEEKLGASQAELLTGNLIDCRNFHTATALQSDLVLAVGGYCRSYLATAELFNPTTGTWSLTGAMSTPRIEHTATLLPSGAVLVVGGDSGQGGLATAELYNPTTGTWSSAGSISQARANSTATLLSSGKVLIVGGVVPGVGSTGAVDIYNPAAASIPWSNSTALPLARFGHTATLLSNPDRVLVIGGGPTERESYNDVRLYDVGSGNWSAAMPMRERRMFHTSTVLPNGKLLVVGGKSAPGDGSFGTALASAELYDPFTGNWSNASPMSQARQHHTAVLQADGKVLVMGGVSTGDSLGTTLASAELYDPRTNTWASAPALGQARTYHAAVALLGKVVVVGGWAGAPLSSTELFDTSTGCVDASDGLPACASGWTSAGALATGRMLHTVTLLPSGRVLISGGGNNDSPNCFSNVEMHDPDTGTWSSVGSMTSGRCHHRASLMPSGDVLVSGGISHNQYAFASSEVFNAATGTWTPVGSMRTARYAHTSTSLNSGKLLVAGGDNGLWGGGILASAELYDPTTKTWSSAASMAAPRSLSSATLLPSGKVLVVGGHNNSAPVHNSAELYNPDTNSWASAGAMVWPRWHHRATLLPSGKVLITGGSNHRGTLSSAELYDPDTNSWSSAGSMASSRTSHIATLLPSGKVLVAGGSDGTNSLASAELYDPIINSWSIVNSMAMPRSNNQAALLKSGKVIVVGGYDGRNFPPNVELFNP